MKKSYRKKCFEELFHPYWPAFIVKVSKVDYYLACPSYCLITIITLVLESFPFRIAKILLLFPGDN